MCIHSAWRTNLAESEKHDGHPPLAVLMSGVWNCVDAGDHGLDNTCSWTTLGMWTSVSLYHCLMVQRHFTSSIISLTCIRCIGLISIELW